jgi:hypothetical protein
MPAKRTSQSLDDGTTYNPASKSDRKYERLKSHREPTAHDILRDRNVFYLGDERRQAALVAECYQQLSDETGPFQGWLDSHKDLRFQYNNSQILEQDDGDDEGADADSLHYFVSRGTRKTATHEQEIYEDKWENMWKNLSTDAVEHIIDNADVRNVKSGIDRSQMRKQFENSVGGWLLHLFNGFNLLFEGVGSKIDIMNTLIAMIVKWRKETKCQYCFIISGYDTNVTYRQLITTICTKMDILEDSGKRNNDKENFALLLEKLKDQEANDQDEEMDPLAELYDDDYHQPIDTNDDYIYLFIHNLDGSGFRSVEAQDWISQLCRLRCVRLVASVDHVNANLLWDDATDSKYAFVRTDVTGYGLYRQESQYIRVTVQDNSNRGDYVTAIDHILRSLTSKHVDVYIILLEHCIQEHNRIESAEEIVKKNATKIATKKKNSKINGMSLEQIRNAIITNYNQISANDETIKGHLNGLKTHSIINHESRKGDIFYSVTHNDLRQCSRIYEQIIAKRYSDRMRLKQ